MKTLALVPLLATALLLAACGGDPPVTEKAGAPLTSSQVYTASGSSPGYFTSYAYPCNGETWYNRQFVAQSVAVAFGQVQSGHTQLMTDSFNTSTPTANEIRFVCPSTPMASNGSYLYSTAAASCQIMGHGVGFGWSTSLTTTVPAGGLRYAPKGSLGWPNGYWAIDFTIPPTMTSPLWGTGYGTNCFPLGSTQTAYAF